MPNRHRYRAITPRPPEDVKVAAQQAAAAQGRTLNDVIIDFLRWFGGKTDTLPERPARRTD